MRWRITSSASATRSSGTTHPRPWAGARARAELDRGVAARAVDQLDHVLHEGVADVDRVDRLHRADQLLDRADRPLLGDVELGLDDGALLLAAHLEAEVAAQDLLLLV